MPIIAALLVLAACQGAWAKDGGGSGGGGSGGGGSGSGGSGGGSSGGSGSGDNGHGDGHDGGGGHDDSGGDGHGGQGSRHEIYDHDYAERAVARGELKPLATVLGTVRSAKDGRVISVDLTRSDGKGLVYRVVLLASGGERWQAVVDARRNILIDLRRF